MQATASSRSEGLFVSRDACKMTPQRVHGKLAKLMGLSKDQKGQGSARKPPVLRFQ